MVAYEQEVRREKTYMLKLPITKHTRCVVQSFNIDAAQYEKNFICNADSACFKFKYCPKVSGRVKGRLIVEAEQNIFAYTVIINVKNIIEAEVKIRTVERKEAAAEIELAPGTYQVICEDINLKYPKEVNITAEQPQLTVSYYSSKPEEKEIFLTLKNEQLGELTYVVKVMVDPMPEIKM